MLGHPVKLGPGHSSANRNQVLQDSVLGLLGLTKGEEWKIPKFLHHFRLHLPNWTGRGKSITVFAPPPPHFYQTCDALGVNLNFKEITESDTVTTFEVKVKLEDPKDGKYKDFDECVQQLSDGERKDKMLTVLPKVHKERKGIFRPGTLGRSF